MSLPAFLSGPLLRWFGATAALALGALGSGCVSTDLLRGAEREYGRAIRKDQSVAFFESYLARMRGDAAVPPLPPEARQHYLGVIANLELVGPTGRQELKREGMLGNAWSLRLLAQWRIGRFDDAVHSWRELQASNQDAPDQRVRALVAAFGGIVRIEDALAALQAGQNFEQILDLVAGPNGAWRALGAARMESARAGATPPEVLHSYGLAIDVHSFSGPALGTLKVERDFEQGLGDAVDCIGAPLTEGGAVLGIAKCQLVYSGLFHLVLTPDYDDAHHNHYHLEAKPWADRPAVRSGNPAIH